MDRPRVHRMKLVLFPLLLGASIAHGGLQNYSNLVVADPAPPSGPLRHAVRITYLGVNGYQFEADGHVLLVDPYFTRAGFWSVAWNRPMVSQPGRVDEGFRHLRPRADAVLVTHAHFDHLLDVPNVMRRTGARLVAGPTAIRLVQSFGIAPQKCDSVQPGTIRTIGPWTIHVLAAQHDTLLGSVPFPNRPKTLTHPPAKPSDWVVGEPLAFMIEAAGKRIYIDSGGVPGFPPDRVVGRVDLAILGLALPDSRQRFAESVVRLHPRFILPSHQDDFFTPLNRGFVFGKLTNFPDIQRQHQKQDLPGRLILLDYFKPWTLR